MAVVRGNDPRWWVILAVIAVLVGCAIGILQGETRGITLKGRLFVGGTEECTFFTDPEGESESITLSVNPGGWLCDYLSGSNTRPVTITIVPEAK